MVLLRKTLYILFALIMAMPMSAKKVQPKEVAGLRVEQEQQFKYYWYAARQAITDERYAEAYVLLQFCNALQPDDAKTLTYLAAVYQAVGDEERAQEAYKKAYELAPQDCWEHYLEPLLMQHLEKQEWKQALQTQDLIDRHKGEYDVYSALTRYRIYVLWGKNKKAIEAIDRYLDTDPTNIRLQLFRLELLERTKAKKKVLYAQYELILELDPYNLMVLNNYAYLLATSKGDLNKAEQMSAITIREEPNNPTYLDTYGWIMHLKGQDELAKFYLNKALWNAPKETREVIQEHLNEIK